MSEVRTGRVWRFADCEFDEWTRVLTIRGEPSNLDAKPLEVLEQLLFFPGKTLTKSELINLVWGAATVDDSLTTAIHRLRRAIGGPREAVIKTIHRVGYRFIAPLECVLIEHTGATSWTFEAGVPVPGDERWRLLRPLDRGPRHMTWLAEHVATHQVHVFQFAGDETGREALGRELEVFQRLRDKFGQTAPQPTVHEGQFDNAPFYLEIEYGGPDLRQWAEQQGGLSNVPIHQRLQLFTALASAVAEVHEASLVHNDLRPENILVSPDPHNSTWRIRLANFRFATRSGQPAQPVPLDPPSPELHRLWEEKIAREVTYRADELRGGAHVPNELTDIYALGVLLYQICCGDLYERPSPGWELRISDPLLQRDIGDAANGNPALRLATARDLASRIQSIEDRRREEQERAALAERLERAERSLAETRARRPWKIAVTVALCGGLIATLWYYSRAVHERNIARQQTAIAEGMNSFLSEDLLGQDNPLQSKAGSNQTLRAAIQNASPEIDRRFSKQPAVAARLHATVAAALENRTQFKEAEHEFNAAARLFRRAEGEQSEDAVAASLKEASMDARSNVAGALDRAQALLVEQRAIIKMRKDVTPDLRVRLLATEAVIAVQKAEGRKAIDTLQAASALARAIPTLDPALRHLLGQETGYIDLRTGHIPEMEKNARAQIQQVRAAEGADSPQLLIPQLQLLESFLLQNKLEQAVSLANELYPKFEHQLGSDNAFTLQVLATRAAAEGTLEHWDDSIRDDLFVHEEASKSDPHSFFALGTLTDAATTECRKGDWAQGERHAREAWNQLQQQSGAPAGLVSGSAVVLADCLIQAGNQTRATKLAEAAKLLDGAGDARFAAALTGNPGFAANITFAKAELAFARDQYASAWKFVREAEPSFTGAGADPYQAQALARFKARLASADRGARPSSY